MAEQIISPGVFTRENDLSFLPAGIGAIGAAIVGPTVKGPAFIPTVVTSFQDFQNKLLDVTGIAAIAGTSFGEFGEGFLRFSCASSEESIKRAIEKLSLFLSSL